MNSFVTPCAFRRRAIRRPPCSVVVSCGSVLMAGEHTPRSGGAGRFPLGGGGNWGYLRAMDATRIRMDVYTPFAELDLLLAEEEQDAPLAPAVLVGDDREPETVDAFNAQILAGLVSPERRGRR